MATRKGQRRKTARRAYMPRRKARPYHKPARQINLLPDLLGLYIVGDSLTAEGGYSEAPTTQLLADNKYNPLAKVGYQGQTIAQNYAYAVKENAVKYAEIGVAAIAIDYIGRKTKIGRRLGIKTKDWNIKVL